jgi:hypothetical protein
MNSSVPLERRRPPKLINFRKEKEMTRRFLALVLVCAALIAPLPLAAQGHSHDRGPNGGQVADAGNYHVEAVAKGETLTVYLNDHDTDKPIPTAGFKGLAILVVGGKTQRVMLAPSGQNALAGKAAVALGTSVKGAIQITSARNSTVQAKF